ncbi:MAG: hypothetical protein Q9M37_02840 [Desulfonauticus sp.]|nr:hypothetical protein [Desulfonauticus sp.]
METKNNKWLLILIFIGLVFILGVLWGIKYFLSRETGEQPSANTSKIISTINHTVENSNVTKVPQGKLFENVFSEQQNVSKNKTVESEQNITSNENQSLVEQTVSREKVLKNKKESVNTCVLPSNSLLRFNFFTRLATFLTNHYDFKTKKFSFSLKQINLTFGIKVNNFFNVNQNMDIYQQRYEILKYLLNKDFIKILLPNLNCLFYNTLDKKLNYLIKIKKITTEDKHNFYSKLVDKIKNYNRCISIFIDKNELMYNYIQDYFLLQERLTKVYETYWTLNDNDIEQKEKLGTMIKKYIFSRELLRKKILKQFRQIKGISDSDKLYLCFWLYRRIVTNKFSLFQLQNLVDGLYQTGEFIRLQAKS